MPEATPGQIAYAAFWQAFAQAFGAPIDPWSSIHHGTQRAWDAAAQAVLEAFVSSARPLAQEDAP